jgi:hypothetical protein
MNNFACLSKFISDKRFPDDLMAENLEKFNNRSVDNQFRVKQESSQIFHKNYQFFP